MIYFIYDATFDGLLTAVFESFDRKLIPDKVISENEQIPLFIEQIVDIATDEVKSQRVWKGLQKKLSPSACSMLTVNFLADYPNLSTILFRYICKTFQSERSIETNFSDNDVLELSQLYRKVRYEATRVMQFLRFQKSSDDIFFGPIAPLHNVLPLVISHFTDRFADQKWVIYDTKRQYGIFYDLKSTQEIILDNIQVEETTGKLHKEAMAEDEKIFQQMWKEYFNSLAIKERINPKLHRQNLPRRFWKYLPEKR
ncbi:MAG: TIGR03915 family putative DNA repair protein [Bacteroidales bacterium]|jgi:probable DNA metabolism protein|nr:TIGR03915 family putative DNA repair protein [Bacteroidales bacterium]